MVKRMTLEFVHDLQPLVAVHDLRLALEQIVELGVGVTRIGDA